MDTCTSYAVILRTTIPNLTEGMLRLILKTWGWGDDRPMITNEGDVWSISGTWTAMTQMNIGYGFEIVMNGNTQLLDTMDCVANPQGMRGPNTTIFLYGCPGCQPQMTFHQINLQPTANAGSNQPVNEQVGGGAHAVVNLPGGATGATGGAGATGATGGGGATGNRGGAGAGASAGAGEAAGATGAAPTGMSTGVMVAIGVAAVGAIGGLVWLMQKRKQTHAVAGSTREPRMMGPYDAPQPGYTMPLERRLRQPPLVYRAPAVPNRRRRRAA